MLNKERLTELLAQVRTGAVAVEDAVRQLAVAPLADLDFAKVDHHRALRCGFPEVIYAPGKTTDQFVAIFETIAEKGLGCLATRVNSDQATALLQKLPSAEIDPIGRTAWLGSLPLPRGRVYVVTAGTSDLPVAREAFTTARVMGCETSLVADVGVAGLHRLLSRHGEFLTADCLVVVAGMEGALPSVVGGLVDCPVVAVPTSVGYGANLGGITALLGMLSSCAANVCVVNIDGGFCGGFVAGLIARRAAGPAERTT